MKTSLFEILRCPYCGGKLELVESIAHQREGDEIEHGVIACHCCVFPVVAGIPVMHLERGSAAAREAIEAGRPDDAVRAMLGTDDDDRAARFQVFLDFGTKRNQLQNIYHYCDSAMAFMLSSASLKRLFDCAT